LLNQRPAAFSSQSSLRGVSGASTGKLVVVGVGDFKVSNSPDETIVTYALGSCLGITFFDSARCVGGLLHIMLPTSKDHHNVENRRAMFLDTGMEEIANHMAKLGGNISSMECKVFGGASVTNADGFFSIGRKNVLAMQELVRANGLRVNVWEVGGTNNRTIRLNMQTGQVFLKTPSQQECPK